MIGPGLMTKGDPKAAKDSHDRADHLIAWLRDYGAKRLNFVEMDDRRCLQPYVVLDLGNRGALGLEVPQDLGGLGLTTTDCLRVLRQLAAADITLAIFVGHHNALGIRPILRSACPALREEAVPLLATGRELGAFALTEPGAGSNPRAMQSIGTMVQDGVWELHGTKIWIGNAAWAGWINVFAKLENSGTSDPATGFCIRQGSRGLRHGPEALTMGVRSILQNTVHLEGVRVTRDQMLGGPGEGMSVAYDAMMYARLGIAAAAAGAMKRCAQIMFGYASSRKIGTGPLLDNPTTMRRLSATMAAAEAVDALVNAVAGILDQGRQPQEELFIACKTAGPELLWRSVDDTMQLLGGRGYIETNHVSRMFRDARLLRIFEGPTETLLNFLGMRLLTNPGGLQAMLRAEFEDRELGDRMAGAAADLKSRATSSGNTMPSIALSGIYPLAGELTTNAILLAAASSSAWHTSSTTLAWLRARFNASLDLARQPAVADVGRLALSEIEQTVATYADSIGTFPVRAEPT